MNANKKTSKKYSRNKKAYRSDKQTHSGKFPQDSNCTSDYNDVSWYAKNDQMLRDAASYSYNQPLGTRFPIEEIVSQADWISTAGSPITVRNSFTVSANSVPGVMSLITGICPGLSTNYRSPINLAAQNIYSFVRYANSGARNYSPEDLMLYMFALDSAYACWNTLKRLYGIARAYSQSNWYLPKIVVEGMGFNYNDVKAHLADLRLYINTAAARLSSFCVPASMPIFVRHSWMFSNIWADASNPKAQLYQFVPLYFFKYSETTNPKGGELIAQPFSTWVSDSTQYSSHMAPTLQTVDWAIEYLNGLIDALHQSEDIGVMSGDILKAYGQGSLFKVTAVPEDYTVTPVYNEEVLNQIHNATVICDTFHNGGTMAGSTSVFNITQDPDTLTLQWNPTFASGASTKEGTLLNMPWTDVTPANTMVGSRLACSYSLVSDPDVETPGSNLAQFRAVGTEFIWNAYIGFKYFNTTQHESEALWYGFKTIEDTTVQLEYLGTVKTSSNYNTDGWANPEPALYRVQERYAMYSLLSQFDWHPYIIPNLTEIVNTIEYDDTGHSSVTKVRVTGTYDAVLGDMANWTVISERNLENMHLTAIMSEFNIPQIGSY